MKRESQPSQHTQLLSGADFLEFVIDFAQKDLTRLRQGDWQNLREDFETYLSRHAHVSIEGASGTCMLVSPTEPPLPENFELRHFQALQRVTLPLLQQIASQQGQFGIFPVPMSLVPHGFDGGTPGRHQLLVHGDTEQSFLTLVLWLIHQEPADRILACPECERLFYRVKQQAYCSRKCGNRVTVRNWRARVQASAATKDATVILKP